MTALLLLTAAAFGADELPPPADRAVDYAADVAPLFKRSCYSCHGEEKQSNGLRLDRRDDALRGGSSGQVILPGSSGSSLLIRLVAGADEDKVMPPNDERLTAEEIGVLRAWIDQGANWPKGSKAANAP